MGGRGKSRERGENGRYGGNANADEIALKCTIFGIALRRHFRGFVCVINRLRVIKLERSIN